MAKLKISVLSEPAGAATSTEFEAMINPASISYSRGINYDQNSKQGSGNAAGNSQQFKNYQPEELSFELMFDGTGAISDNMDVAAKLTELEDVVYNFQGEKHRPNYVMIVWSNLRFRGQLKSFKTDYTLFDPNGLPLRAKVALSFVECIDQETREQQAKKSSPDMTHLKTVREGDRLTLLCDEIYNDFSYYVQVAEKNNILNFRELEVGTEIFLPPLSK